MKLYIKQKVFAIADKFNITDEAGSTVYTCKGKVFSIAKNLTVLDDNKQKVIQIKQKLFTFMPKYKIFINGQYAATMRRKFSLMKPKYWYEDKDWSVQGDFLAHNSEILAGGYHILTITKRWLAWGDTYELDLRDGADTLLAIASAIIIDCVCHPKK
jgi:uncharacterized protein YxjI